MKLWSSVGVVLAALIFAGCGETGASPEELGQAFRQGERAAKREAVDVANRRVAKARNKGYWSGWSDGWDDAAAAVEEEADYDEIDPTPERLDGTSSYEFEPDDIARAESASQELQDYCAGAVSEAQEIGCLSHVDPEDIP